MKRRQRIPFESILCDLPCSAALVCQVFPCGWVRMGWSFLLRFGLKAWCGVITAVDPESRSLLMPGRARCRCSGKSINLDSASCLKQLETPGILSPDYTMTEPTQHVPRLVDESWLQPARVTKATVILSLMILTGLLAALLHPDSMPHNQEAFGDVASRLGVPLRAFVAALVAVVFLPLPFAFWHLFRIIFRGASEGETMSRFGLVRAVFTVPERHPDLRTSRLIVLIILGGYITAMFTYAYMADERDLERKRQYDQHEQGRSH